MFIHEYRDFSAKGREGLSDGKSTCDSVSLNVRRGIYDARKTSKNCYSLGRKEDFGCILKLPWVVLWENVLNPSVTNVSLDNTRHLSDSFE